jgi:molybdopterin-guanine dinucleotide biosynthesis protein A
MEIEKLIVKYLVGCLSKEEDQILKKWLQEDESHLRFFQKISLDKTAVEDYRQYHRFDAKSDEASVKYGPLYIRELEGYQRKEK